MIEVVIIGQNEGKFANDLIASLPSDWQIHYVADRCIDNTIQELVKFSNVNIIDTTDMQLEGRQTSFCRNLGLSKCNAKSDVLFLDGDRYVAEGDIKACIEQCKSDVLLFKLENERRNCMYFKHAYGNWHNMFYSCGLFMTRHAIEQCIAFAGSLFDEDMQDLWGIEDTYLGDVCFHLGLTAELTDAVKLHGCFTINRLTQHAIDVRMQQRKLLHVNW